MKFAVLADLHLTKNDPWTKIDSELGISQRNVQRLEALKESYKVAVAHGCSTMFLAGDLFDKLNVPEFLKKLFYEIIVSYNDNINTFILVGNHDGAAYTHNYHTEKLILNDLLGNNSINIIDEYTEMVIDNEDFVLMPWTTDLEELASRLKKVKKGSYGIGHLEINGALSSTEYTLTSGLNPILFSKFKKVYLGHYHRKQDIKNITYVGSPIMKDISETGIEKGFIIYDTILNNETFFELEKLSVFDFTVANETLDSIDTFLETNSIPLGSLIVLRFKGTREWVKEILNPVIEVFEEFKPLKIIKNFKYDITEDNKEYSEVQNKVNRVDRIRELAKDESDEFIEFGINKYLEMQKEYIGA